MNINNGKSKTASFISAKPIWPAGHNNEMNLFAGFRALIPKTNGQIFLRITACSFYRAYINGIFAGFGPARAPHKHARIDELDITGLLSKDSNVIAVETAGYNIACLYTLKEPPFLQAEIVCGNTVLASTQGKGSSFECKILPEKIQKIERYSAIRTFIEGYQFENNTHQWRQDPEHLFESTPCDTGAEQKLLYRGVPNPRFPVQPALSSIFQGQMEKIRSEEEAPPSPAAVWSGFSAEELDAKPCVELLCYDSIQLKSAKRALTAGEIIELGTFEYEIIDFGTAWSGSLGMKIQCDEKTKLLLTFDEILTDNDINYNRIRLANIISLELAPGIHPFESFEPYNLRYLKIMALKGSCRIEQPYIREHLNGTSPLADFSCSDNRWNSVFEAAIRTFTQNSVDMFTDNPNRERTAWLCDTYFTAKVANDICPSIDMEHCFFENFLLPDSYPDIPAGMLPKSYPSDHPGGKYVPTWAMWFVVQLEAYFKRSRDHEMVKAFKPRVEALFDFFKNYLNEDGLLESLEGWVFIDFSKSNDLIQDVNYPVNMLYTCALDAAARMYDLPKLYKQAEAMRRVIREQSFDGKFFTDNAVRTNGRLELSGEQTETCQYYAFFSKTADSDTHPELWNTLVKDFGITRDPKVTYPEIHRANMFTGFALRLELLSDNGRGERIFTETINYYTRMINRTGTIWQDGAETESCNCGFASHIAHLLIRNALGLNQVNTLEKTVLIRFCKIPFEWCEGTVPIGDEEISLSWRVDKNIRLFTLKTPPEYTVSIENNTGQEIQRQP